MNSNDKPGGSWFKGNLVALGSAAVLTVYAAGYVKTRAAAQRFAQEDAARQRPAPVALANAANAEQPNRADASLHTDVHVTDSTAERTGAIAAGSHEAKPTSSPSIPSAKNAVAARTSGEKRDSTPAPASKNATVAAETTAPAKPDSSVTPKTQAVDSTLQIEKPRPQWKDGTYKGYGTSRHGDIEAEVEIKGGRIVFAYISQCLTQYPCAVFDRVVPQVISRQSAEVDYVSGATQSVNAFYYAVVEALSKAK